MLISMRVRGGWFVKGIAAVFVMICIFTLPSKQLSAAPRSRVIKSNIYMKKGTTRKTIAGVNPAKVRWRSRQPKVATVKNGVITARRSGMALLIAQYRFKKYYCVVHVVDLNKELVTLNTGKSYQLKVKNGVNTRWYSSNPNIVSVDGKGKIHARKNGVATIKCKTGGIVLKAKVCVPSINRAKLQLTADKGYRLTVKNCEQPRNFFSVNSNVAEITQTGYVRAKKPGKTKVGCRSGLALLTCELTVMPPDNLTTPMSSLPTSSRVDRQLVEINSYPRPKTYTVYNQNGKENLNSGNKGVVANYMPGHGCAACSLTTVLNCYKGSKMTPAFVTETVEKKVFGQKRWKNNYTKPYNKQSPMSLYGISTVLSKYKIKNTYVRCFPGAQLSGDTILTASAAEREITKHLKTGNPVIIEVSKTNWASGESDNKWSNSVHTMVLLGMTDTGKAIIADPANRSVDTFGKKQRIKYATVKHLTRYMFSCTRLNGTNVYWDGKATGGGYILVNP